jgi:hypothetical protein
VLGESRRFWPAVAVNETTDLNDPQDLGRVRVSADVAGSPRQARQGCCPRNNDRPKLARWRRLPPLDAIGAARKPHCSPRELAETPAAVPLPSALRPSPWDSHANALPHGDRTLASRSPRTRYVKEVAVHSAPLVICEREAGQDRPDCFAKRTVYPRSTRASPPLVWQPVCSCWQGE